MTPRPRIVAPVCTADDVVAVAEAGADEMYCGAMFDDWVEAHGDADFLTRRQGRQSHLRRPSELRAVADAAHRTGTRVALALNARYTERQERYVMDLARAWEDAGGDAVVVADVGILIGLEEIGSKLERHLSLLAGAFNSRAVAFFRGLGVRRVVLPRDLALPDMADLAARSQGVELEALAMYQRCEFVDGMCLFYHGVRLPRDVPAAFDRPGVAAAPLPVVWSHDPGYEGHGCQLPYRTVSGPVRHAWVDDETRPHCAACQVETMARAGVGLLKIAGRAYSSETIVKAVRFLRRACELTAGGVDAPPSIRRLYAETFGSPCHGDRCYYCVGADGDRR